jgi:hypothetical protein
MTNPENNTSNPERRSFLLKAATAVAGSAALAVAATIAGPSRAIQSSSDPILEAIEAHRAASAQINAALEISYALDRELPLEKCRSHFTALEESIVPTDDPRWIDSERNVMRAWNAQDDAAIALLNVSPTTHAGLLSLMRYALAQDTDGEAWGMKVAGDDGRKRHWYYFLIENVTAALTDLVSA